MGSDEPSAIVFRTHTIFMFVCLFVCFRATPATYGGSQARGPIRATAAGLLLSHRQCQIQAMFANYTTAHGNAESLPH